MTAKGSCCCTPPEPPYSTLFVLDRNTGELIYKFPYVATGTPYSYRMGIDLYGEPAKAYEVGTIVPPNFHGFKWDVAGQTRDWTADARVSSLGRSFLSQSYLVAASLRVDSTTYPVGMLRRDDGSVFANAMIGSLMDVQGTTIITREYVSNTNLIGPGGKLRSYSEDGTLLAEHEFNKAQGSPVFGSPGTYPGLTGKNVADRDNQYFILSNVANLGGGTVSNELRWVDGNDGLSVAWTIFPGPNPNRETGLIQANNKLLTDGVCGWLLSVQRTFSGQSCRIRKYCGGYLIYNVTLDWSAIGYQTLPFLAVNDNLYGWSGGGARARRVWRINGADGSLGWISSHELDGVAVNSSQSQDLDNWNVVVEDGVMYCGFGAVGCVAIDEDTGYVLWTAPHKGYTRPVVDDDGVWTVGRYDQT